MTRVGVALLLSALALAWAGRVVSAGASSASPQASTVTGRAYEEPRTPRGVERPLAGAVITLMPRSNDLLARLAEIRAHARDSHQTHRAVIVEIWKAKDAYETVLRDRGDGALVFRTASGGDGTFTLDTIPPGRWILIATHAVRTDIRARTATKQQRKSFYGGSELRGYETVTVWVRELEVPAPGGEPLELTDRNVWLTGIREERAPDVRR